MDAIYSAAGVARRRGAPDRRARRFEIAVVRRCDDPVDTAVPGCTRNDFTGTAATFARHGFTVVARRKDDRPVTRRRFRRRDAIADFLGGAASARRASLHASSASPQSRMQAEAALTGPSVSKTTGTIAPDSALARTRVRIDGPRPWCGICNVRCDHGGMP